MFIFFLLNFIIRQFNNLDQQYLRIKMMQLLIIESVIFFLK